VQEGSNAAAGQGANNASSEQSSTTTILSTSSPVPLAPTTTTMPPAPKATTSPSVYVAMHEGKRVLDVKFSPEGTHIASGGGDATVKIWDWITGDVILTLEGHTDEVEAVAFRSDGKRIASCSGGYGGLDNTVRIWDANNGGDALLVLQGNSSCFSVTYSPSGELLAAGFEDGTIAVWNANSGFEYHVAKEHNGGVHGLEFSPDGEKLVSSADDGNIIVREVSSVDAYVAYTFDASWTWIQSLAHSADGTKIVTASMDKTVNVYQTTSKLEQELQITTEPLYALAVDFSHDGKYIAAGLSEYTAQVADHAVKIYDAASGALLSTLLGHTLFLRAVRFSPDGKYVVSSADDGTIRIWPVTL